jgi:hypothetical protein
VLGEALRRFLDTAHDDDFEKAAEWLAPAPAQGKASTPARRAAPDVSSSTSTSRWTHRS